MRTLDVVCLQENWLFNFQLKQLNALHKDFEEYGKAVDDDDPFFEVKRVLRQE